MNGATELGVRRGSGDRRLFVVGLASFGVFGGLWGVWAVLLADLSHSLDLSTGPLGLALSGGVMASIPAMVLGGRAVDRLGHRALLVTSGGLMGLSFAGLAVTSSYGSLIAVLLLYSATSGIYDVATNAFAMDLEQITGRRVLAPLHAAFSGGGAGGALIAGALISAGVDYRYVYVGTLLPVGLVIVAVALTRFPQAASRQEDDGEERIGLYQNLSLILVAVVAALAFFSEGTMEDWSGIYLRQTLALPAVLGASGVAIYHAAMAVGRLGSAWAIKRFGSPLTLLGAGLLVAGGMMFALATREPLLVIVGFLVVGLALAATTPIAFSIAGDIAPDRVGGASSVVATLGYSGFLVGPTIVGGIAEFSSLRVSLLTIVLAGLLIAAGGQAAMKKSHE
jgi:MFS family permease